MYWQDNKIQLTFLGFFGGFGVGVSSSGTVRFFAVVRAEERVVRDDVDVRGLGVADWSPEGGGLAGRVVLEAARPPHGLPGPGISVRVGDVGRRNEIWSYGYIL